MSIRMHERFNVVPLAKSKIAIAVLRAIENDDLTEAELGQALTQAFADLVGERFRMAIRLERHGNYEHKGDEA